MNTAGFRKIHLDCSMSCGDDPRTLSDEVVAERAALLCAQAEEAWESVGGEPPVYVIGTEVPVPGGAQETLHELSVTEPRAALATVAAVLAELSPPLSGQVANVGVEQVAAGPGVTASEAMMASPRLLVMASTSVSKRRIWTVQVTLISSQIIRARSTLKPAGLPSGPVKLKGG